MTEVAQGPSRDVTKKQQLNCRLFLWKKTRNLLVGAVLGGFLRPAPPLAADKWAHSTVWKPVTWGLASGAVAERDVLHNPKKKTRGEEEAVKTSGNETLAPFATILARVISREQLRQWPISWNKR